MKRSEIVRGVELTITLNSDVATELREEEARTGRSLSNWQMSCCAVVFGRMTVPAFVDFLKKLHADARRPIVVIADNASYHRSGPVKRDVKESKGQVLVEYLPPYAPELNPDEQMWNQAKARLGKRFVATKEEFRAAVHSIMKSIQHAPKLVLSFFQLPDTKYAAQAG